MLSFLKPHYWTESFLTYAPLMAIFASALCKTDHISLTKKTQTYLEVDKYLNVILQVIARTFSFQEKNYKANPNL